MTLQGPAAPSKGDAARPEDTQLPALQQRWVRVALGVGVTLLVLLPALVTIGRLAGRSWLPVQDFAVTDLRVRDVLSWNTPLTGPFGRLGWNHPGPLMFWLMAAVSGPTGFAPWAIRISGAVIQGGAVLWLAWLTWRHSLRIFLAAATVTALSYLAFSPLLFTQPWNPSVAVVCFILFLYLTTFAAAGRFRQVIAMSVVGNVIVQSHVSYALLIGVCFAWVLACTIWDARRDQRAPDRWKSTLVISAAVWVVAWAAPVVGVIVDSPGNLGALGRYFFSGGHSKIGLGRAVGIMAAEFSWVPNWLGGWTPVDPINGRLVVLSSRWWLVVPVVLLVGGFLAARRTRSRFDARALGLGAVLLIPGIFAISSADQPLVYTFQWRVVLAVFIVVSSVWSIAAVVAPRVPSGVQYVALGTVVAVIVWGTVDLGVAVGSSAAYTEGEARGPVLGELMDQVRADGLPDGVVLVRDQGSSLPSVFAGVVDDLDRAGVDVRVDPRNAYVYGEGRSARARDVDEIWSVVEEGSYIPALLAQPGARVIASTTPLTPEEDAEITDLQQEVLAALERAGAMDRRIFVDSFFAGYELGSIPGVDRDSVFRLQALNAKVARSGTCRCAIVASAGGR